MRVLDFGNSFIGCKDPDNSVRFWVESRTSITDEKTGKTEHFFQCGSCKSEHTFASRNLFVEDNFDFMPVFGPTSGLHFRSRAYETDHYRTIRLGAEKLWGGQNYRLVERDALELSTIDQIIDATAKFHPLVAETEIRNDRTKLRAVLHYPVKTMNIHPGNKQYQVDTGPLAFPDLNERREHMAEYIWLAFCAFNAIHFADFVIEAPTPILKDGVEVARVPHYSKIISLPARNRLFAVV